MSALRAEVIEYVNLIPEEKLPAIKPLLFMLSTEQDAILEKLADDDLTDEEREAFERADAEYERGETTDFEDLLREHELIAATGA